MDFGMPSLIETKTCEECAALCRELGLSFIELNMNLPQYQAEQMDVETLRSIAAKNGIYFTIHLDENLNVCDFNSRVACAFRETVYQTIEKGMAAGCPVLNMHLFPGVYFTMPDRKIYLFDEYRDQYLENMAVFREECEKRIGCSELKICVENSDGYTGFQKDALSLLLESPVFGLTFDIGHNHVTGGGDEAVIMQHAGRLCHMHMHDAAGGKNHLAAGSGEIDIPKYLNLAERCGCRVVLETKTIAGLKQSVDWIRRGAPFVMPEAAPPCSAESF